MLELQRLQWELDEFIDLLKFYSHEKDELLYELFKAERKSKEVRITISLTSLSASIMSSSHI